MTTLFTEGETCSCLIPAPIETLMTGAARIFYSHPRFHITYTDGETEEAICPELPERPTATEIVSAVQSKRLADEPRGPWLDSQEAEDHNERSKPL